MLELVTEPFIELLRLLVQKGADVHSRVDKLEFYRELDLHKRHIALLGEARDQVQEPKTRVEVIAE